MPRRNHRSERQRASDVAENLGDDYKFTRDPQLAEKRAANRRTRRMHSVAIAKLLGPRWTTCIVEGCKFQATTDLIDGIELPICTPHAVAVWESIERRADDPDVISSADALRERARLRQADSDAETTASKAELRRIVASPDTMGEIYFVRVGDLIKVGWSSDLEQRVKSYGASAVLLVHFPGTRRDEGLLHQQLAPALARGREWFKDGDILRLHIDRAIEQHGSPIVKVKWTEHRGRIRPRKG